MKRNHRNLFAIASALASTFVSNARCQAPLGFDPINMAKETKGGATPAASKPQNAPTESGGIDLSKLTSDQLAALQKQLKDKKKTFTSKKKERFEIIDTMLQEKTENGKEFRWTTRDILNRLVENDLVDTTEPKYDQNEIKKIQARKQHLEKLTDKAGKLVHPAGKFGYKQSMQGFNLTSSRIVEWFTKKENLATLTQDQVNIITKALP